MSNNAWSGCQRAQIVFDRFHVQRLVQDALDEVRRAEIRALEGPERQGLKKTRWALLKNFWDLSAAEYQRLSTIQKTNKRLYRAYLLKAGLARTEGINGKIRTITRRAYGFHHAPSLIGLIMLCCTGLVLLPISEARGRLR